MTRKKEKRNKGTETNVQLDVAIGPLEHNLVPWQAKMLNDLIHQRPVIAQDALDQEMARCAVGILVVDRELI